MGWSSEGANSEVVDLSHADYERIRRLVYAQSGINLGDQKVQLVRARLGKLVRRGGFRSFHDYFRHVEEDPSGEALCGLLDAISTNTTHLFREIRHFQLLRKILDGWLADSAWCKKHPVLRIWSAGCSSGEEPYSIAMVAHDAIRSHRTVELKILATDLSVQVLSRAKLGFFESHRVGTVPAEYQNRYFQKVRQGEIVGLQIISELRQLVTFRRFNLMSAVFPFQNDFHVIFCRNVMIYFDQPTQETLVNKYAHHLAEGGYLMIGHSESLNGIQHPLSYVEPTVYRK